jgi:ATP-dependent RNA helicase RhlE
MSEENNEGRPTPVSFGELGLAPKLLEAIERLNFSEPTPIQAKAIPVGLAGKDIFGIAQTGTGKTMAFGLPMLQRVARHGGRGLVVLPTRELALQVQESLHKVAGPNGLRTAILIGGASMQPQLDQLRAKPHIIVATPGRILDHLEQKNVKLDDVSVVVLDEADRMMDMGFMPQVRRLLMATPKERQTMLFSATMPEEIATLAERYMRSPVRVEVDRAGTPAELVDHLLYVIAKDQKNRMLDYLLGEFDGTVLVFTRTRHGAARVCRAVRRMGHRASEIHSDRSLSQRRAALDGFKSGTDRVLVATDIAARGIDVNGIELVVNYDVPDNPEDYVHRIGRTGRAGEKGLAITLATSEQGKEIQQIEKLAQIMLQISELPELPPDRPRSDRDSRPRDRGRRSDRSTSRPRRREAPATSGGTASRSTSETGEPTEPAPNEGEGSESYEVIIETMEESVNDEMAVTSQEPTASQEPATSQAPASSPSRARRDSKRGGRERRRSGGGRDRGQAPKLRGGAIHANSDGPIGFEAPELGEIIPEIGGALFEGTPDFRKSGRSGKGGQSAKPGRRRSRSRSRNRRRR